MSVISAILYSQLRGNNNGYRRDDGITATVYKDNRSIDSSKRNKYSDIESYRDVGGNKRC
jgi:hypothetical protein